MADEPKPEATPDTTAPAPEPTPETVTDTTPTPEAPAAAPSTPPAASAAPAPVPQPSNGLAIAALVVGIVAVISGWAPIWGLLVGGAAVTLGILALKKPGGRGMAIAGLVTGGIGALWGLLVTILFVVALAVGTSAANTYQEMETERNNETQSLVDAKKDFAKGETANFADKLEVKVNSVEKDYNPGQYYTLSEGKEYILVNVTVKNISEESEYLSSYDFAVLDNGIAKTSSFAPADSELEAGDLQAGGTTTGNIVYEVTKGANDLKLQYTTTVFDEDYKAKELSYTLAF